MNPILVRLARQGDIGWLSCQFAGFIARQAGIEADHPLVYTAALVCEANRNGDVCIDLARLEDQPYFSSNQIDAARMPRSVDRETWRQQLLASHCVGETGERAPLTLDGNRLYLNRFWYYENAVAIGILARVNSQPEDGPVPNASQTLALDADQLSAIKTAASRRFCVISGGPGSGKTATVIRILERLLIQDRQCRIALAAPTGKAAARMMESIRHGLARGGMNTDLADSLPEDATTIHRLLAFRWQNYGFHRQRRLPVDCVVIDEASMLDLKLLFHLLEALPDHARLILLGDRDQLASVSAGNVLGDITGHGRKRAGPIVDSIALLQQSYRFASDSAVGELAAFVNQGRVEDAIGLLEQRRDGLNWYNTDVEQIDPGVLDDVLDNCMNILNSVTPQQALSSFATQRLLCASNHGALGVEALNRQISTELLTRSQKPLVEQYHGQPIMILRNQHELNLFNGDTGILWQGDDGLQACFSDGADGVRRIALNRVGEYVPAWASTVHKSQGSEFDSVVLVLPADPESPLLVRELLYTAITRARKSFCLHGSNTAVRRAIGQLTRRHSGLADMLGWSEATT